MTTQLYIANLAQYNAGRLVGRWIDADQDADDIRTEIAEFLESTGGEEWACHDYDGLPSSLGEWPDLDQVSTAASLVEEHDDAGRAYLELFDSEQWSQDDFLERYVGEFETRAALAEDLLESTGELSEMPERLAYYFDFDSYGRDMEVGGDVCRHGCQWFWAW